MGCMLDSKARITMARKAYNTALDNTWGLTAKKVGLIYENLTKEHSS